MTNSKKLLYLFLLTPWFTSQLSAELVINSNPADQSQTPVDPGSAPISDYTGYTSSTTSNQVNLSSGSSDPNATASAGQGSAIPAPGYNAPPSASYSTPFAPAPGGFGYPPGPQGQGFGNFPPGGFPPAGGAGAFNAGYGAPPGLYERLGGGGGGRGGGPDITLILLMLLGGGGEKEEAFVIGDDGGGDVELSSKLDDAPKPPADNDSSS